MKVVRQFVLMSVLMVCAMLNAQTQHGYVKTKGRLGNNGTVIAGMRLQGATVSVRGGNSVVSGNNGAFSLTIPTSNYYLQNVQKQGYVLTDPDVLSRQYVYSKNPLVLVMETPSHQADDKLAVEKKIRRTLQRQLQEKEDEIEALKEQNKLSDEACRKQLQELYAQQESNGNLISEMSDRYSRIDFDDMDEFNRRISSLILEGRLTEADSLLNTKGDINSRTATLRQHQEADAQAELEIKKKQKDLEKSKALTQKELEDLSQDCYSKYEIFKMQHQNDSAAYYIVLRANLDTLDIYAQNEAAGFLEEYMAKYEDAYAIYKRMQRVAECRFGSCSSEAAMCCNNLGTFFLNLGQYDSAEQYFSHALDIYRFLGEEYAYLVAVGEGNLGSLCMDKQDYPQAMIHFEKEIDILRELYGDECDDMANAYNSIGQCYSKLQEYKLAEDYFLKVKDIWVRLYGEDSYDVSIVNNNLAGVLVKKGLYNQAEALYNKVLSCRRKEFGINHPKIASVYNNLSSLFLLKGSVDSAYVYQQQATKIWRDVYGEINPIVADSYGNLSAILQLKNDWRESLEYLRKAYDIAMLTRGTKSVSTRDIMANLEYVMCRIIKESEDVAIREEHEKFMKDKVFAAYIPQIESSPAAKKGMSGEYYILQFENWNIECDSSMLETNEALKGKPKTLVFIQGGDIQQHCFENVIGAQLYLSIVGQKTKADLIDSYKEWKNQHAEK